MRAFLSRAFLQFHAGRVIGGGFFAASLFLYRSFQRRALWGLWSYSFFALILAATAVFIILIAVSWRGRRKAYDPRRLFRSSTFYLELGILAWGVAYFISAVDDRVNAALVTTLSLFGTISPIAACLQWFSLVLLCVAAFIAVLERVRKRWTNVLVSAGAFVAVVVVAEGGARFKTVVDPETWGYPTYSSILWENRYVNFNTQVFRDDDHALVKPHGARRLLMIGDSFAFGWGVKSLDDRMDIRIGKALERGTNERWETMNMAHGETTTLDHIRYLKQALPYKPDIVLLLYAFNDMNYLFPIPPRREFYGFGPSAILYRNSYLFQEIFVRLHYMRYRYAPSVNGTFDPYRDDALLNRHFEDLAEFVTLARRGGASVWIIPFDIRLSLGEPFVGRYEQFVSMARSRNLPVLSLEETLRRYPYHRLTVNRLDAHPNAFANRLGAEAIVRQLPVDELGPNGGWR
jgi:hypothetical protein